MKMKTDEGWCKTKTGDAQYTSSGKKLICRRSRRLLKHNAGGEGGAGGAGDAAGAGGEEGSAIKQSGLAHVQHCGKSGTRFLRANQRIICSCNH